MGTFTFTRTAINETALRAQLADPAAGGYISFEGWVRNHNEGLAVRHLEYEAFEPLAVKEGERIIAEAVARFGIEHAACVHRIGDLAIGEMAVWVGVSARHRHEAFVACRYIIDEVKHRVPIWKKEHYENGDSGWVNCERCVAPGAAPAPLPLAVPTRVMAPVPLAADAPILAAGPAAMPTTASSAVPDAASAHTARHLHAHDHQHTHDAPSQRADHSTRPLASSHLPDYSRQIALKEVGALGQAKLRAARVLIVGCGGLGVPVISYLAGAGVARLGLVDGDRLEPSNLHRQTMYALADVGGLKAELAAARVRALNPDTQVDAYPVRLDAWNAADLIGQYDLIIDCTDNFATKFLLNDLCVSLGKPAVFASVYQYEGQLQIVRPERNGACLRCVWPEATRDGIVGNCAEAGVLGPVPGVFGGLQALEALKVLLDLPGQLGDEVLVLDLLTYSTSRVRTRRASTCPEHASSRVIAARAATPGAVTSGAVTSGAVTPGAVTSAAVTPGAVTSAAVTSGAATPSAVSSAAVTSGAVTSAAVTSGAATPSAVNPEAVTPAIAGAAERAANFRPNADLELSFDSLDQAIAAGFEVIDIREPQELRDTPTPSSRARHIPLAQLLHGQPPFTPSSRTLLVCASGRRSLAATQELRSRGLNDVYSFKGGVSALRARLQAESPAD